MQTRLHSLEAVLGTCAYLDGGGKLGEKIHGLEILSLSAGPVSVGKLGLAPHKI